MKENIIVEATTSKTERVRCGSVTASVRTDDGGVTAIENGVVKEGDVITASFSKYQGGGLNVNFYAPDADEIAILGTIKQFINDVNE